MSHAERRAAALCRVVAEIHAHGWCQGTSGNFSVTLSDEPLELLISRSGIDKGRLTPDDLLRVDSAGEPLPSEGASPGRPSAETLLHCVIAARGARATLHTHSVAGTLLGEHFVEQGGFTISGYEMLKGLRGIRTHRAEVWVPVLANAQDMQRFSREVESLLDAPPEVYGFLIAGHGLYTWGMSLEEAHRQVEIFEFLFECLARRTPFRPFTGQPASRA